MKEIPIKLFFVDKSVLENHHIAASWLLTVTDEKYNIFEKLDRDEYNSIRKSMISMVLATDMTFHFTDLNKMKARLASSGKLILFHIQIIP